MELSWRIMPADDLNFKAKTTLPRVRIHLRLPQPHLGENVIRLQVGSNPSDIRFPAVAYAAAVLLKNVVPVVNEELRQKIEKGEISKTPCAFLEGDLVAWMGRFREKAPPLHKAFLAASLNHALMQDALFRSLIGGEKCVGFNPKKMKFFYMVPPQGLPVCDIFKGAESLAVLHWHYSASGDLRSREIHSADFTGIPATPSKTEIEGIKRGRNKTMVRLHELGLNKA